MVFLKKNITRLWYLCFLHPSDALHLCSNRLELDTSKNVPEKDDSMYLECPPKLLECFEGTSSSPGALKYCTNSLEGAAE